MISNEVATIVNFQNMKIYQLMTDRQYQSLSNHQISDMVSC
jgi:hypothetical protein